MENQRNIIPESEGRRRVSSTAEQIDKYILGHVVNEDDAVDVNGPREKVAQMVESMIQSRSVTHQVSRKERQKISEGARSYIRAYRTDPLDNIDDITNEAVEDLSKYIESQTLPKTKSRSKSKESRHQEKLTKRISEMSLTQILDRIRCRCNEKLDASIIKDKTLRTKDGKKVGAGLDEYGIEVHGKQPCDVKVKKNLISEEKMRRELKETFDKVESKIKSASEMITTTKLKKRKDGTCDERFTKPRKKQRDSSEESLDEKVDEKRGESKRSGIETDESDESYYGDKKSRQKVDSKRRATSLLSTVSEKVDEVRKSRRESEIEEERRRSKDRDRRSMGRSRTTSKKSTISEDIKDAKQPERERKSKYKEADSKTFEEDLSKLSFISRQRYRDSRSQKYSTRTLTSDDEAMSKKMNRYGVTSDEGRFYKRDKDRKRLDQLEKQIIDTKDSTITSVIKETTSKYETEKVGSKLKKTTTEITEDAVTLTQYHDVDTQEKTEYCTEYDTYINKSPSLSSHSSKSLILIKDETEEVDIEYVKRELFLKSDEARQQLQDLYRTKSDTILRQFLSLKKYTKWFVEEVLHDAEEYVNRLVDTMDRLDHNVEEDVYERKDVEPLGSDVIQSVSYEFIEPFPPIHFTDARTIQSKTSACDNKSTIIKAKVVHHEEEGVTHLKSKESEGYQTVKEVVTIDESARGNTDEAQATVFVRKNYDDAIVTEVFHKADLEHELDSVTEHLDKIHIPTYIQKIVEKNETESVKESQMVLNLQGSNVEDFASFSRKLGDASMYYNKDGYPIDVLLDKSPDVEYVKKLEEIEHIVPQLKEVPSQTSEKTDVITHITQTKHTLTKISTHRALSELHVHQTERGEVLTVTSKKHALDIKITLMPKKTDVATVYQDISNLRLTIGDFDLRFGYHLIKEFIQKWPLKEHWTFCIDFLKEESDSTSDFYIYEVKFSKPTAQAPIPKVTVSVFFTIEVSRIIPLKCLVTVTYVFEGTSTKYEFDTVLKPERFLNHIVESKLELIKQILF